MKGFGKVLKGGLVLLLLSSFLSVYAMNGFPEIKQASQITMLDLCPASEYVSAPVEKAIVYVVNAGLNVQEHSYLRTQLKRENKASQYNAESRPFLARSLQTVKANLVTQSYRGVFKTPPPLE